MSASGSTSVPRPAPAPCPVRGRVVAPRRRSLLSAALSAAASAVALIAAAGCDRDPPDVAPYVRPAPRRMESASASAGTAGDGGAQPAGAPGCPEARPGAAWLPEVFPLRIDEGSALLISDPSVLGGPFEPPLRVAVPAGDHAVRVLTAGGARGVPRPLCVEVRLRDGQPASWKQAGDVVIDVDAVVLVDERRAMAAIRAVGVQISAGVDAPPDDMPRVVAALASAGLPLEPVLPSLWISTRPIEPGDEPLVRGTLKRLGVSGRFSLEPRQPALRFLRELERHPPAALVSSAALASSARSASSASSASSAPPGPGPSAGAAVAAAPPTGVAVDVPQGEGAYVVWVGLAAGGEPVVVDLRLE
jgi:hypothetical protein